MKIYVIQVSAFVKLKSMLYPYPGQGRVPMEARGQDLRVDLSLNPEHSKLIFGMWTTNSPTMQKRCLTKANIFCCLFSRALPQRPVTKCWPITRQSCYQFRKRRGASALP